ncbi:hypothetical protein F2Q70_00004323 [Brassica cretica]|uniref:Uncharacterized protein n=1 Tax=Brassica cretica TaxID=69181 RepID=A0A8S9FPZ8_BRACR|nr:hypothetical protein F2Q68_00021233 [Brassica cretica]KAF2571615.1 hypothetical protein F2Q70_00004323 [Brassica cretica]
MLLQFSSNNKHDINSINITTTIQTVTQLDPATCHDPTSKTDLSSLEQNLLQVLTQNRQREMGGGRGIFIGISNQSETSRVAARVSLRMAADTCAATPHPPHGWLDDLTCSHAK